MNLKLRMLQIVALSLGSLPLLVFCVPEIEPTAQISRVQSRSQLIGGPRALGEIGDYLLENDKIRIVVQDKGFSRGFGIYGGSIIDADLVRARGAGSDSSAAVGYDNFGEMFPAFFLEAMEPHSITILGGTTDEAAQAEALEACGTENEKTVVLHVRAYGSDFLAMTESINEILLGDSRNLPALQFDTCYRLTPGQTYLEIETTITNIDVSPKRFPGVTSFGDIPTPLGDIMLFGAGNKIFIPHEAGYDLRFRLQGLYESGEIELPAFPGLVADYIAAEGPHVSYGLVRAPAEAPTLDFAHANKTQFKDTKPHSLHIPFIYSAFTGVFEAAPPSTLGVGESFKFKRYFVVGGGSVSDISDVAYNLVGERTGLISGKVTEKIVHQPAAEVHVIVVDTSGRKITSCITNDEGRFSAQVPAGTYGLVVQAKDRHLMPYETITVEEGGRHFAQLMVDAPAWVSVKVVSKKNEGAVPAKVTLVGQSEQAHKGRDPRNYLFDLSLGESRRYTDMVEDTDDPDTRQYIEKFQYTKIDGTLVMEARPGTYTLVVSRGMEYDRFEAEVELIPGRTVTVLAEIERVIDSSGYVSADFHLHSRFSLDSDQGLEDRVTSFVGEGLEYAISTDHNFVVDYSDTIAKMNATPWLNSAVGLELTTLDRGHFNGFPMRAQPIPLAADERDEGGYTNTIATRTYGSFEWGTKTPDEVFDALRDLADENVEPMIQVNHPRSPILGYFTQYNVDPDNLLVKGETGLMAPNSEERPQYAAGNFSWNFDAIEVLNAKDYAYFHSHRIPEGVTVDPDTGCAVTPGEVLREWTSTCEVDEGETADPDCECVAGDPAWPGVIEDWFQILKTGKRVVGTANSDSHNPGNTEPGTPRTFVAVSSDTPMQVSPDALVKGLRSGNALMTNGPFITLEVIGESTVTMGGTVQAKEGQVQVRMRLQAPAWIKADTLVIFYNGEPLDIDIPVPSAIDGKPLDHTLEFDVPVTTDGFLVFELNGASSMFPTLFPNEVPPLEFSDVIGALGSSFGIDFAGGAIKPAMVYRATPFALTNPVWVDADGDGEITPAMPLPPLPSSQVAAHPQVDPREHMTAAQRREWVRKRNIEKVKAMPAYKRHGYEHIPSWMWPTNHPSDIRRIFTQFTCPH